IIALTSQLCHIVSNCFVKSPTAGDFGGFSAGSFKDLTRVAQLNEAMWTDLFSQNRVALLAELDIFSDNLARYRAALAQGDDSALEGLLREGREIKEGLTLGNH
ncbi:prephenate dehydrogenase dimerization domain-containing protein, partial [Bittarella massiliensis (ex Durand et al. 2017)]